MKKLIYTVFGLTLLLGTVSCEKFFDRGPINKFDSINYFKSESDLEMYANGMVNSWLPNYTETASGDAYNDLIATKTSSDFYRADVIWGSDKQTGWSSSNWSFLRRTNFMLQNMSRSKDVVSAETYNHYEGVARFWRAYQYFSKIRTFSDVPWVEVYMDASDEESLYATRDDREFVFKKMTEDILFASANCRETLDPSRASINKWVVNAWASRMFLYEASFRLNHPTNPSTGQPWKNDQVAVIVDGESTIEYTLNPQTLYQLAAQCAKVVIDGSSKVQWSLSDDYAGLFISNVLNEKEVIWGRTYASDINGRHSYTRYFHSSTLGQQYSGTKDLIRHFLWLDGTFPSNEDEKLSINQEFNGRDKRLAATVLGPGRQIKTAGGVGHEQIDFTFCKTGYQIVKWSIPDDSHFQNGLDENSIPIIRYAEVLLNYAEAMNEQGLMTSEIWDQTAGALRRRAGLTETSMPTSVDQWLKRYYSEKLANTHITEGNEAVALELRRERVTELTFESELRLFDLYRWGQADLIARRSIDALGGWRGIYISAADAAGFNFEGLEYTIEKASEDALNSTTCYPVKDKADAKNTDWFLTEGSSGFLVYKYDLKWEDKMYCRPIPLTAKTANPALGENFGW